MSDYQVEEFLFFEKKAKSVATRIELFTGNVLFRTEVILL